MSKIGILDFLGFPKISIENFEKLKISTFIIKFALLLEPEKMETNIKTWINTRQVLATNLLNQVDLNVLIGIQQFTKEISKLIGKETMIYNLLKIREKIYKLAHKNTRFVMEKLLEYVSIRNDLDLDVKTIMTIMDNYIISIDELEITGETLMTRWGFKGKEIKELKNELLDLIFLNELENKEEELIKYIEKKLK